MEISVGTSARPLAGIVMSLALYKSCPAAYGLPFVGALALSDRSRTCSRCSALAAAATLGAIGAGGCREAISIALDSGVGVAVPEVVLLRGDGSITFVRLGRGELGREGGSWVTEGVATGSADIFMWFGVRLGGLEGCWRVALVGLCARRHVSARAFDLMELLVWAFSEFRSIHTYSCPWKKPSTQIETNITKLNNIGKS